MFANEYVGQAARVDQPDEDAPTFGESDRRNALVGVTVHQKQIHGDFSGHAVDDCQTDGWTFYVAYAAD